MDIQIIFITGKLHLELKQPEGVEHNEKETK